MQAPGYVVVARAKRGTGPRTKKAARRLAQRRANQPAEWRNEMADLFGVAEPVHDYRWRTNG
jgi:hypothetical protein